MRYQGGTNPIRCHPADGLTAIDTLNGAWIAGSLHGDLARRPGIECSRCICHARKMTSRCPTRSGTTRDPIHVPPSQNRPPSGLKRAADRSTPARIRKELEERYEAIFECPPDQAPWGAAWSEVLAEARAADGAYVAAEQAMADIHAVLGRAARLVYKTGRTKQPYTFESRVGLTVAEALLSDWFLARDAPLGRAFIHIEKELEALRRSALDSTLHEPRFHAIIEHAADDLERGTSRPTYEDVRDRWHVAARLGTSRRIVRVPAHLAHGALVEGLQAPALLGRPPQGSAAAEADSWLRAYVAEVLDTYPLRPRATDPDACRLPLDAELAVVSLVLGGVDGLSADSVGKGTAAVIDAERRAIKRARRRRAILTPLCQMGFRAEEPSAVTTAADSATATRSVAKREAKGKNRR